jgi:hypothetical protein
MWKRKLERPNPLAPDNRGYRPSSISTLGTLPVIRRKSGVELIETVVAHDFHSTRKKLKRPQRIDPWREGRETRGKLLFVRIWKLPP